MAPRKPDFLDNPWHHTTTRSSEWDPVRSANPIEHPKRKMDFEDRLVITACVISLVAVFLLMFGGVITL